MPGLLVADDMPLVRSTVASVLAREQRDFGPLAQASSGAEAVSLARQMQPDIVLMDIQMPDLDGLQASALIRAEHPTAKIIYLTAHDEFAYVQQALRLGAIDYLLKPVRPAALITTLAQAQACIDQERIQHHANRTANDRLQRTLPLVETGLVERLVAGQATEISISEALDCLGTVFVAPLVLLVEIDQLVQESRQIPLDQLADLCRLLTTVVRTATNAPEQAIVGHLRPGQLAVIVSGDPTAQAEAPYELAQRIRRTVETATSHTATIGIGRSRTSLTAIDQSYAEARLALWAPAGRRMAGILQIEDLLLYEVSRGDSLAPQLERQLVARVRQGQNEAALQALNELADTGAANADMFLRLVIRVGCTALENGASASALIDLVQRQCAELASIQGHTALRRWAHSSIVALMALARTAVQPDGPVTQAMLYIQNNLHCPELSLKHVAAAVGLSQSHLAALLRTNLGRSYIDYLTHLRIERAKKLLLATDLTIAAVAEEVGYQTPTNFYRVFRRETSLTPAAYRRTRLLTRNP